MRRHKWPLLVSVTGLWATLACATLTQFNPLRGNAALPTPTAAATLSPDAGRRQQAVLDLIDQAVREQYLYADFGGVDWAGAVAASRARLGAGLSEAAFAAEMRALAAVLPAETAGYQTRAERLAADTADPATFQGIGVYYGFRETPEPRVVILEVIPGSPAEAAGLQAHDALYAIDGQPVRADERATISDRIRGPAGSSVTLSVQTPNQARRDVTVQRGTITAVSALRGGMDPATGIMYYRVPVAGGAALAQTIADDLAQAQAQTAVRGILLDLRLASASGGWPLQEMLTLFGDGTLGEFFNRTRSEPLLVAGLDVAGSQTAPLALLIGPDTRGAVEVFASGLQNTGRAVLVGQPTAGETAGFTTVDLPDGSQLTLLTSGFRRPDGSEFAGQGLTPDVRVDADWDTFAGNSDDPVLLAALQSLVTP